MTEERPRSDTKVRFNLKRSTLNVIRASQPDDKGRDDKDRSRSDRGKRRSRSRSPGQRRRRYCGFPARPDAPCAPLLTVLSVFFGDAVQTVTRR